MNIVHCPGCQRFPKRRVMRREGRGEREREREGEGRRREGERR